MNELQDKLALIDSCIYECNEYFQKAPEYRGGQSYAGFRKTSLQHFEQLAYLKEKRKNIADKVETALSVMVTGW